MRLWKVMVPTSIVTDVVFLYSSSLPPFLFPWPFIKNILFLDSFFFFLFLLCLISFPFLSYPHFSPDPLFAFRLSFSIHFSFPPSISPFSFLLPLPSSPSSPLPFPLLSPPIPFSPSLYPLLSFPSSLPYFLPNFPFTYPAPILIGAPRHPLPIPHYRHYHYN